MEKLQPVIKQIFWILFGLAMMLILFGWWTAHGQLSTQIADRQSKVAAAFSDANKNVSNVPNQRWTEGAEAENETHEAAYSRAAKKLWEDQLGARVFPDSISGELEKLELNSQIKDSALRERFGHLYRSYFLEQLQRVDPFEKGEGLVLVNTQNITQENEFRWATRPPTSPEIWNAQEDIWLLSSIYDSIAMVNKGAERIDKAPLRALLQLRLRGGDPEAPPGGSATGGGFGGVGGGEGYEAGVGGGAYESGGGFGGGGFGGVGGAGGANNVYGSFVGNLAGDLLTEEFGAVGGGGGGFQGIESYEAGGEGASFGSSTAAVVEEKRYVHDDENMPYRTRAFILQVKILQSAIPSLLAELTNSKFPVEIVRVDASFGNSSPGVGAGGGGYAGGGYGGGEIGGGYESAGGAYEGEAAGGGGYGGYGGGGGGIGAGVGGMGAGGMGAGGIGAGVGGGYAGGGGGGGGYGGYPGGAPGMGGGIGMGAGGAGVGPLGPGTGAGPSKPLTAKEARKIQMGERVLADAMRDPDLSTVRVAGLMTLYWSKEENEAAAESEAAAEAESQQSGGETSLMPPESTESNPAEEASGTDTTTDPAATPDDGSDQNQPPGDDPTAPDAADGTGLAPPATGDTPEPIPPSGGDEADNPSPPETAEATPGPVP